MTRRLTRSGCLRAKVEAGQPTPVVHEQGDVAKAEIVEQSGQALHVADVGASEHGEAAPGFQLREARVLGRHQDVRGQRVGELAYGCSP